MAVAHNQQGTIETPLLGMRFAAPIDMVILMELASVFRDGIEDCEISILADLKMETRPEDVLAEIARLQ